MREGSRNQRVLTMHRLVKNHGHNGSAGCILICLNLMFEPCSPPTPQIRRPPLLLHGNPPTPQIGTTYRCRVPGRIQIWGGGGV